MQDGSAATTDKAEQSHEAEKSEDNECLSLRIRLPDGKVSIGNMITFTPDITHAGLLGIGLLVPYVFKWILLL